ncbi:MAG: hypothetical protein N7Q72_05770, partial [Spiroplasma sp. Tabriz.8]|nr:hypothetical protein [Candidatus Karelsulcia muelleri]MCZ8632754.1 hypothetical protein [Spiroplasma sp. Tabriz.8]
RITTYQIGAQKLFPLLYVLKICYTYNTLNSLNIQYIYIYIYIYNNIEISNLTSSMIFDIVVLN